MANPLVGIIMGSKTDLEVLNGATEVLKEFGIEHEVRVLSAHRTPEQVLEAMTLRPLAAGEPGDVVVVGGDPLQDLDALGDVRLVVRGGRRLG